MQFRAGSGGGQHSFTISQWSAGTKPVFATPAWGSSIRSPNPNPQATERPTFSSKFCGTCRSRSAGRNCPASYGRHNASGRDAVGESGLAPADAGGPGGLAVLRDAQVDFVAAEMAAPKGRKVIAQGNALGERRERGQALKGAVQGRGSGPPSGVLFRPFRARECVGTRYPGRRCALPWAVVSRPFRPEQRRVHS